LLGGCQNAVGLFLLHLPPNGLTALGSLQPHCSLLFLLHMPPSGLTALGSLQSHCSLLFLLQLSPSGLTTLGSLQLHSCKTGLHLNSKILALRM